MNRKYMQITRKNLDFLHIICYGWNYIDPQQCCINGGTEWLYIKPKSRGSVKELTGVKRISSVK